MAEDKERDIDSFEWATKVDNAPEPKPELETHEPGLQDDGHGLYVENEDLAFGRKLQRALTREGFPVIGSDSRTPREDGIVDRATLFQVQRLKKSLGMKPTTTLTKTIKRRLGL